MDGWMEERKKVLMDGWMGVKLGMDIWMKGRT